MLIPGMRYQDTAWGVVKREFAKIAFFAFKELHRENNQISDGDRTDWANSLFKEIQRKSGTPLYEHRTNWMKEPVYELLMDLAMKAGFEAVGDQFWKYLVSPDFLNSLTNGKSGKFSEKLGDLRDEIDVQNYLEVTGDNKMTLNRLKNLRKIEQVAREVEALILNWQSNPAYVADVLGHSFDPKVGPLLEIALISQGKPCRPSWIWRYHQYWPEYHRQANGDLPVRKVLKGERKGRLVPDLGPLEHMVKKEEVSPNNLPDYLDWLNPVHGRFKDEIAKYCRRGVGGIFYREGKATVVRPEDDLDNPETLRMLYEMAGDVLPTHEHPTRLEKDPERGSESRSTGDEESEDEDDPALADDQYAGDSEPCAEDSQPEDSSPPSKASTSNGEVEWPVTAAIILALPRRSEHFKHEMLKRILAKERLSIMQYGSTVGARLAVFTPQFLCEELGTLRGRKIETQELKLEVEQGLRELSQDTAQESIRAIDGQFQALLEKLSLAQRVALIKLRASDEDPELMSLVSQWGWQREFTWPGICQAFNEEHSPPKGRKCWTQHLIQKEVETLLREFMATLSSEQQTEVKHA